MTEQAQISGQPGAYPLKDIRVIDIGGIGPAPFASLILRELGASVIRLDRPTVNKDLPFDPFEGGSEKIRIDLKSEKGRAIARSFIEKADILIEGHRPGAAERLGMGPEDCHAINPGLVYGRITGWGQSGPLAHTAGHDINYIALSGALHAIGTRDGGPVPPINLIGDFAGGTFYLVIAILSALVDRQRTGKGRVLDIAMLDGASALMRFVYAFRAAGMWEDKREANMLDGGTPWYGAYETADGKHIALGAIEQKFYDELIEKTGLAGTPDLPSRAPQDHDALREKFTNLFRTKTRDEWASILENSDACAVPVLSLDEAPNHPQVKARGIFPEGSKLPRSAPRMGEGQPGPLPPVFEPWGFSAEELAEIQS